MNLCVNGLLFYQLSISIAIFPMRIGMLWLSLFCVSFSFSLFNFFLLSFFSLFLLLLLLLLLLFLLSLLLLLLLLPCFLLFLNLSSLHQSHLFILLLPLLLPLHLFFTSLPPIVLSSSSFSFSFSPSSVVVHYLIGQREMGAGCCGFRQGNICKNPPLVTVSM